MKTCSIPIQHLCLLLSITALLLAGCGASPGYAELLATATVSGCWPGNAPTPPPQTVTPLPGTAVVDATSGATTTPYPRCTPGPGEVLTPYPSTLPVRKTYPTVAPRNWLTGADEQNALLLPGTTYQIALAAHPTNHWPVVAAMQRFSLSDAPTQVFVRVYNPHSRVWNAARQLDIGESTTGDDPFAAIVVGVTGADEVIGVWGSSDRSGTLWTSSSRDYGTTWSTPQPIASNCWVPESLATSSDGQVVVLGRCYRSPANPLPAATFVVRRADGTWQAPQQTDIPAWFGSVVLIGDGPSARAVAMLTAKGVGVDSQLAYLAQKPLAADGPWQVTTRAIRPAGIADPGESHQFIHGISFTRPATNGTSQSGVLFSWLGQYRAAAYALVSIDGGQSWGAVEPIVFFPGNTADTGRFIQSVAPAYDPVADRLVAFWTCCTQDGASTHFASWSRPQSGQWLPAQGPYRYTPMIPLVTGAAAAQQTVAAQAANSRSVWLAWVDRGQWLQVRSYALNTIIPVESYPTPTAEPAVVDVTPTP